MVLSSLAKGFTLVKDYCDPMSFSFWESVRLQHKTRDEILQSLYPNQEKITSDFHTLPLHNYNDISDHLRQGQWYNGEKIQRIQAYATSSGTSSGGDPLSVKYFPITQDALSGAYDAMLFMLAAYMRETWKNPYDRKLLSIIRPISETHDDYPLWYISGILDAYSHSVSNIFKMIPSSLLHDIEHHLQQWEYDKDYKMNMLIKHIHDSSDVIGILTGVPHRLFEIVERYTECYGVEQMYKKFDIQLCIYGGGPTWIHRTKTRKLFPNMFFANAYNSAEWFFAIQDRNFHDPGYHAMRLMIKNKTYYEFIKKEDYLTYYKRKDWVSLSDLQDYMIDLEWIQEGEEYVVFVSTTRWLVRYNMGDVITFINKDNLQIEVNGRINGWCNHLNEHIEAPHIDRFVDAHAYGIEWYYCITHKWDDERLQYLFVAIFDDAAAQANPHHIQQSLDASLQQQNPNYKKVRDAESLLAPYVLILQKHVLIDYLTNNNRFVSGQTKLPRMVDDKIFDDKSDLWMMLRELWLFSSIKNR